MDSIAGYRVSVPGGPKAGRVGPFVASAEITATRDDTVVCRAELRDDGADKQVIAVALLRARAIRQKGEVQ